MPEANSASILSNPPSRYPQIAPEPAKEAKIPGHTDVKTTMSNTFVLNHGLAGFSKQCSHRRETT
jgi:hypothetical protein